MEQLPENVCLYATRETLAYMNRLDDFLGRPRRTRERPAFGLSDGASVELGPLRITAYSAEHSAEGSAMLRVERGGKSLLYTGDYKYPSSITEGVDLLMTEGTMLTRDDQAYADEAAVEAALCRVLRETEGRVFLLTSSANLPRIQSVMNAHMQVAEAPGGRPRPVMQDLFLKYLLEHTGHRELAAPYGFLIRGFDTEKPGAYHQIAAQYRADKAAVSGDKIADFSRAVVFIRPSMADMLKKLIREGMDVSRDALVFSMWRGYGNDPDTARLLALFAAEGVKPQYIHTSGHANWENIKAMIEQVRPRRIACIHSENSALINELAGDIPAETGSVIEL